MNTTAADLIPARVAADATGSPRYLEPGWFTRNVFNRSVRRLTRIGISVWGSRELRVLGRTSGICRSLPVNLLTVEGERYLVSPRGMTQWVRNLRVAGEGELRVGRRIEAFTMVELDDVDKPTILREYLRRWKAEVGVFFDGLSADATDAQLAEIAPGFPVFRVITG
ncbi:MAG: nitroreductase [Acidimicrobiales bacterium]|nr:nitroreductase [Acidimicrobiales bacterium]